MSQSQMPWWMNWKCQTLLAGGGVQADEALGVQVVTGPVAAVEIDGRRLGGDVHVDRAPRSALSVRPRARRCRCTPRSRPPRSRAPAPRGVGMTWKLPQLLAGAHVVAAHVTRRALLACRDRRERRADDDHVSDDDRRRRRSHRVRTHVRSEPFGQIHLSAITERRIGNARLRGEAEEPERARHEEDALLVPLAPVGDAAPRSTAAAAGARVLVGREHPDALPRARIESDDAADVAGGGVEAVAHLDRCRLEVAVGALEAELLRAPPPDNLQVGRVRRVDLVERRVAGACRIGAEDRPLPRRSRRLPGTPDQRQSARHHPTASPHSNRHPVSLAHPDVQRVRAGYQPAGRSETDGR